MQEKKWRVLIVDDEFRIGMLIKKLIRWEELNMECIDAVDNGETAYHLILQERPDLVITDIRMPKINGLDLISMIKEQNLDTRFVVISGYKEFEYAHRALQYGVNDYLLKPIDEKELNKVLHKIHEELQQEKTESMQRSQIEKTISASEHIIKRNFLNNIIEQEDVSGIREDYSVSLDGAYYRGIDIKLDYSDYEKTDKKQDRLTVEKIIAIVETGLKSDVEEVLICEKESLHIYCLFNYDHSKTKEIKGIINDILSDIQEYLMGFEQYEVTIGVGTERSDFGEIRFSIKEAYRAAGNRIKLGTGRLIYADALCLNRNIVPADYLAAYKENLLTSIEAYSREELEQSINRIYSDFQLKEDVDFSGCYDVAAEVIRIFFEQLEMQKEESEQIRKRLTDICQHCHTITKLKEWLKKELGEYLDMSRQVMETESTKPVRQAKQYIEEHYNEKIVLEDIAAVVDLNPVYFSVLFKKETGMNFSAYLVHVRMEIAKDMICSTNETIAAIGERVGYRDSRYFSQIFAKTVGVKPALYRKLHS